MRVRCDCMSARVPFSIPADCATVAVLGTVHATDASLSVTCGLSLFCGAGKRDPNLALLKTAVALMPLSERPITRADSRDGLDSP